MPVRRDRSLEGKELFDCSDCQNRLDRECHDKEMNAVRQSYEHFSSMGSDPIEPRPYITKVLSGDVHFTFSTAVKLAKVLQMDFVPELKASPMNFA